VRTWRNGGLVRLVMAISTLLGPEGTTRAGPMCGAGASGREFGDGLLFQPGMTWSSIPLQDLGCGQGFEGRGGGR